MKGVGGVGEGAFFEETFLRQTCQSSPRPSFSSFPRAFVLNEFLSSLEQAVFGMTTLQRYNAPKIFSGSIFFFSQNGPACSSLIHSPSCLEAMLSFPCILPMQADKKRGTRTSLCSYNGTPSAQPPHQYSWEGKRRDWGWEREPYLQKGSLSHPQTWFSINSAPRRREAFPAAGAYTAS